MERFFALSAVGIAVATVIMALFGGAGFMLERRRHRLEQLAAERTANPAHSS